MQIFLIFSLILAIIAVLFAVFNAQPVTVNFLFGKYEVPLAASLLIAMLLGAVVSLLFSTPSMAKSRWANRNYRKRISELETTLSNQTVQLAAAQQKIEELEKEPSEMKSSVAVSATPEPPSEASPILPTTP